MKLIYSPTSPYARKVRAVIIEKQLEDQIEMVPLVPSDLPKELLSVNALSRVPTLVRDNGQALIDSPVICEYLDSLGDKPGIKSGTGDQVWDVRHLHAFGDGIIDTAFTISMERRRDESEQSPGYIKKQIERVVRGVKALEAQAKSFSLDPNLGEIAVACALGYLDFRLSNDFDWRADNQALADWHAEICKRPSMAQTTPPQ